MAATITTLAIENMQASDAWKALTPRLKMWIVKYAEARDAVAATRAACKCKNEKNARLLSYHVRSHKKVKACIALLEGKSERDLFIESLRETVRKSTPGSIASLRGHSLLARMLYHDKPPADELSEVEPERKKRKPKHFVGQRITQDGVEYTVTVLGADGSVEDAKPVEVGGDAIR
jgi:hypothetical protein